MPPAPQSSPPLSRRVILVTGASGGIGSTIVSRLTGEGGVVVGVDVAGGADLQLDASTVKGCRAIIREVLWRHGRVDAVVLAAGVQHISPLATFPDRQWQALLAVLLTGPFRLIREAWPHLSLASGRIVAIGSVSSHLGESYKAAYVAAKHGLFGLIKTAAIEGAPFGMTANLVAPGWVRTPMVERQLEAQVALRRLPRDQVVEDVFLARQPQKRFVEPDEVAQVVSFLLVPGAASITGSAISIDGGWTAL